MTASAASSKSRELTDLADCIGWDAVEQLVRHFRGQRITVPKRVPGDDHAMVRVLGRERMELLVSHYPDERIYFPMSAARELEVLRMAALDPRPTVNDIARAAGLSYRGVQKILARQTSRESQPTLFDLM